jgi:hypothetical protein
MRKLFIFLSVLIVFAFMYYLVFYTITRSSPGSKISEIGYRSLNSQDSFTGQTSEIWKIKLSMKQIDSLTSVENYTFTIENYLQDASNLKPETAKTKKI